MNKEEGVEHCCKIGCMASIKQAMLLQKVVPDAEPWIFYTDIRADGKGYEEFYVTAQDHKVHFVRGRVAEVVPLTNGELLVKAEDTLLETQLEGQFDLVVLVMGIIPNLGTEELAKKLGIQVGSDGFLLERHYKLRPVDSQREGVFVAGCALSPKDVRETTLEAMATASRVATFVGKGKISLSPEVAYIIQEKCDRCEICIKVCPVAAVEKSPEAITINPISCIGCGICVPRCPPEAIELKNSTEAQLMAQIRGVSEGGKAPKIIAFLEKEIAYGSADLAGQSRVSYPSNVRIVGVPTTGRVGLKHVLQAFAYGADGVVFIEDHGGVFTEEALREQVTQMKKELRAYGVEPLRLMSFSTTLPEYNKVQNTFETFDERISKMGLLPEETRSKIKEKIQSN
jgi:heterodisulfide reductase subunit A